MRGFARHSASAVGNAWVDLRRVTLYLLLLALIYAVFLVSQGTIQNFAADQTVTTLDAGAASVALHTQTLPMGPVAYKDAVRHPRRGTVTRWFASIGCRHEFC